MSEIFTVNTLIPRARSISADAFAQMLGQVVLIGPAVARTDKDEGKVWSYETVHAHGAQTRPDDFRSSIVLPVRKRADQKAFQHVFLVGRASSCDIPIDDPSISKLHARIAETAGKYLLTDSGSTNGSFVNTKRLKPEQGVELSAGDTIRFGDRLFKLYLTSRLHRILGFMAPDMNPV